MADKTILVVDDDPEFRELLKSILLEGGYRVRTAGSGGEALEAAKAERPDMVLVDVEMPGMDGYGFTEAARADESLRDVPIIIVTVHSAVAEVAKGLRLGADDHVTKPFHTDEVLLRVESLFRRKGSSAA